MGNVEHRDNYSQDHSTHRYDNSRHTNIDIRDDHRQWIDNSRHDSHSMYGNQNVNMHNVSSLIGNINISINLRSTVGLEGPEVSNTTSGNIRIYYSDDEMQRDDILSEGEGGVGELPKFKGSVPYVTIPPETSVPVPPDSGIKYVSVYLESSSGECEKVIAENYSVPENVSFVITPEAVTEEEISD